MESPRATKLQRGFRSVPCSAPLASFPFPLPFLPALIFHPWLLEGSPWSLLRNNVWQWSRGRQEAKCRGVFTSMVGIHTASKSSELDSVDGGAWAAGRKGRVVYSTRHLHHMHPRKKCLPGGATVNLFSLLSRCPWMNSLMEGGPFRRNDSVEVGSGGTLNKFCR